jgi:hypothetical protein
MMGKDLRIQELRVGTLRFAFAATHLINTRAAINCRNWSLSNSAACAFGNDPEHYRSVATRASRWGWKVFGFVKRSCVRSEVEAERR